MGVGEGEMAGVSKGSRFKVAVIGDFMEDIYWIGEASTLSAEVPIPVVKIKETKSFPGGAGNVAENLEALGCDVTWELGTNRLLPKKNRLMVGDHQVARWDENDHCLPTVGIREPNRFDAIVIADYGKGAIPLDMPGYLKEYRGPIFVDTKRDPSCWSGVATAVFPNWKEYLQFGKQYDDFDGIVVTKKGADGLHLYSKTLGYGCGSPSQAHFVRSVNGAGDVVLSNFVFKWLEQDVNKNYQEILDWCNTAAAIAVESPYTTAVSYKEVYDRFISK